MPNGKKYIISAPLGFTHGTMKPISVPAVLSNEKIEKELFWANALRCKLPKLRNFNVHPNDDDSNGNHDVILKADNGQEIGVQVTELTSELKKDRFYKKSKYLCKIIKLIQENKIISDQKILINFFLNAQNSEKFKLRKFKSIIQIIKKVVSEPNYTLQELDNTLFSVEKLTNENFYAPNINNIGINIDIDQIYLSSGTYKTSIDYLFKKKTKSKSPWLLIWSTEFKWYEDLFGETVLSYMKDTFKHSNFEKVYFLESLESKAHFCQNLNLHIIK